MKSIKKNLFNEFAYGDYKDAIAENNIPDGDVNEKINSIEENEDNNEDEEKTEISGKSDESSNSPSPEKDNHNTQRKSVIKNEEINWYNWIIGGVLIFIFMKLFFLEKKENIHGQNQIGNQNEHVNNEGYNNKLGEYF